MIHLQRIRLEHAWICALYKFCSNNNNNNNNRTQRHMGRDCWQHAGCFLCGTKCGSGRKGSGDRCREEVCQVQRFVIQPYFIPVAVESLGPLADDAHRFITEIGRRMTFSTADPRETAFLYQRISVAIQRYNAVCLANTLISDPL